MANGDLSINITATDRASDKLDEVAKKVQRVGDEEGEVIIKAEIKSAEADLRKLRRQLKEVDGEEAEAIVLADIERAKSEIKALKGQLDDLDSTVAEPKIEADDAGGAGGDAGMDFGLGAIKGLGASGMVAALGMAFSAGMDRAQMRARFQSEFGLIKEDADRLGKQAGDIYADGWGNAEEEVLGALGRIDQALVQTGQITEDESAGMVEAALAIAGVYGVDVNEVIRSTGLLMKNGLATDATEATDIVISGLQDGANEANDFFDTIDEYAQHFGAMGLSGADMNAIIIAGFQDGQRDADKLADAVKEMRIRSVEDTTAIGDAYAELGLDADEYRTKIASGGPAAREAFIDILRAIESVEDPVRKQALAVELIGTQYEDLGDGALDALLAVDGATQDLVGHTGELIEVQAEATSELEMLWRNVSTNLSKAAEFAASELNSSAQQRGELVDEAIKKDKEFHGVMRSGIQVTGDQVSALDDSTFGLTQQAEATEDAAEASEEHEEALKEERKKLDDLNDALREAAEELLNTNNAKRAAADAAFALRDAEDDMITTVLESTEALNDGELSAREKQQAIDNVAQSAGKLADAEVRLAEETAAANGETLTATESLDIMNTSMLNQAATASGPLRQGILDYIASTNQIPAEKMTDIRAAVAAGDLETAQRLIDEASRARDVTLTADANVSQANSDLDWAARRRVAAISARYTAQGQWFNAQQSHTGSRFAAGETKIVVPGQVFTPDVGGRMSSVEESRRMTSDSGTRRDGPLVQVSGDVIMNNGTDMEAFAAKLNLMVQS